MVGKGGLATAPVKESTYLREQRGQSHPSRPRASFTFHASRFTHLQPISSCSSVSYSEGRVDDDSLAKASFMKGGAANVVITAIANTTP